MTQQSEQLEREADQARARLSGTLEELRSRLTPGQVVDELVGYGSEGPAADFLRNLTREIQENPLPLLLIGVGIAWLIVGSSRRSQVEAVSEMATGMASMEPIGSADPITVERLIEPRTRSLRPVDECVRAT